MAAKYGWTWDSILIHARGLFAGRLKLSDIDYLFEYQGSAEEMA